MHSLTLAHRHPLAFGPTTTTTSTATLNLPTRTPGKSCAEICPGDDLPWKPLYRATVAKEAELEGECEGDPTAKWGPMNAGTDGKFAIAFSGGLRNFITNW